MELCFAKSKAEENKAAFDKVFAHKSEIETALGTTLSWKRSEDTKQSKIFISLSDVSIENEVDWLQMAKFHAEWSKKFYDVIVPYVLNE